VAALLAADHARLEKKQSTHSDHYRRIKGEDQGLGLRKRNYRSLYRHLNAFGNLTLTAIVS
jgi:hypothetical protein